MDDHIANREMMMTGMVIALSICALVWQVLRILSRGALDGRSLLRLSVSVFALGIMLYVGHTIFSMWTGGSEPATSPPSPGRPAG